MRDYVYIRYDVTERNRELNKVSNLTKEKVHYDNFTI